MASYHSPKISGRAESPETVERRHSVRYRMTMEAEYRVSRRGRSGQVRTGRIIDLSAEGLMLECQTAPEPGVAIEMTIPWPSAAIELRLRGETVRADGNTVGVRIHESTFRLN